MKKSILLFFITAVIFGIKVQAQDLISGGSNSWIFHTPDNERTDLVIAPKIGNSWGWGSGMMLNNEGKVYFSNDISTPGKIESNQSIISKSNYGFILNPSANDAIIKRGTPGNLMLVSGGDTSSIFLNYAYGSGNGGVRIYDGGKVNFGHLKVSSKGDLSLFSKSGKIGIGTTTPDEKLTVSGNIKAQNLISGGSNSWMFHTPDDTADGQLHIVPKTNDLWNWNNQTVFYNDGKVHFNGNVGIGLSDPNARFETLNELRVRLSVDAPNKNVARITQLGNSGITGAMNWALRGVYQYADGVGKNSAGGD